MSSENIIETDVLIIGGGIGGMFAAIKAKEQGVDVTLVDKGCIGRTGASIFGGGFYGFFSVFNPAWGHKLSVWMKKLNETCEYINNREWTEIALRESYNVYQDLIAWGVPFENEKDGSPRFFRENPPLDAFRMKDGRRTPYIIRKQVVKSDIRMIDRVMITNLLKQDDKIIGAIGFHAWSGDLYIFKAGATVITTGSGSFKQLGMPITFLTSDGEAMVYRAGAELSRCWLRSVRIRVASRQPDIRPHGQESVPATMGAPANTTVLSLPNPCFRGSEDRQRTINAEEPKECNSVGGNGD